MEVLEGENQQLRSKLVMMERYSRGDSLEVHNLPKKDNENVHDLILGITDAMYVDMSHSYIICAYRLPASKNKSKTIPQIFVKFTRRSCKREMYVLRIKK